MAVDFLKPPLLLLTIFFCLFISCQKKEPARGYENMNVLSVQDGNGTDDFSLPDIWNTVFEKSKLPDSYRDKIQGHLLQGPEFVMELFYLLETDPFFYKLVDKQNALDRTYVPDDLVELQSGSYRVTRQGLMLRKITADSLESMAAAALRDGVTLTAASAFRTYDYQAEVYNRNVREMGQQAADRESARPGHSQHQLGLTLDFFPIDDSFAQTPAYRWLAANASRFGWSMSYPHGFEEITGYVWESWHYRYVGAETARFIDRYFDGIQQYALVFINAWITASVQN